MKLFNYFSIGLVSLMLCAGFTSCGGDDEPDGGNGGNGGSETTPSQPDKPDNKPDIPQLPSLDKRIVKIVNTVNFTMETARFTYDEKGKLSKATHSTHEDEYFQWEGNTIKINATKWDPARTYTLDDKGMVVSIESTEQDKNGDKIIKKDSYEYQNGQLAKLTYSTLNQDGEKIVTHNYDWKGDQYFGRHFIADIPGGTHDFKTVVYNSGKRVKGAYIVSAYPLFDLWVFYAHPERGGLLTDVLPTGYEMVSVEKTKGTQWNGTERQIITKYILRDNTYTNVTTDEDGYITGITEETLVTYFTNYSFKDLNEDGIITPNEKDVREDTGSNIRQSAKYTYTWEKK